MQFNVTALVPLTVNSNAVAAAVQGLVVNCNLLQDYEKAVDTDTDRIHLNTPGAQGQEVTVIDVDTSSSNNALDEVGSVLVDVPLCRFTTISKDGIAKTGSRLFGNVAYILDRTTADSEADVFCVEWRGGGSRWKLVHWVIDTSAEALATTIARTDSGTIS